MRQQDPQESDFRGVSENSGLKLRLDYGLLSPEFPGVLKAGLLAEASIECVHAHRGVLRDGLQSKQLVRPFFEPSKERLKRASVWGSGACAINCD